jgi:predicted nucleic acid-binding protein
MKSTYLQRLNFIFDAYYAATALNAVPDHAIASTDEAFDNVTGIKRIDPRSL